MEMHRRKSRKRDRPEDAMETDTCAHDILSLSKVKFLLSTSGIIFSACEYSNDDILVAYDLERGSQCGVMKGHDVIYVAE